MLSISLSVHPPRNTTAVGFTQISISLPNRAVIGKYPMSWPSPLVPKPFSLRFTFKYNVSWSPCTTSPLTSNPQSGPRWSSSMSSRVGLFRNAIPLRSFTLKL
eukprot:TRINITY_DN54067_c0_g1_i1.p1 TRINITY_DN54067_c0_g1~~TRINITY_DN54067_c0_g1_i1.p1  ORF type:complete len:103 (+),score=12.87 TRINITY_DN54067_c0_g1_i1:191-499(+)